jgi:hypothetical protein
VASKRVSILLRASGARMSLTGRDYSVGES